MTTGIRFGMGLKYLRVTAEDDTTGTRIWLRGFNGTKEEKGTNSEQRPSGQKSTDCTFLQDYFGNRELRNKVMKY